ncbi:hypothetical protein GCM10009682_64010 [Luedemannella flava]|uniref:Uncharacterized protein n=1 Tax=Luedemannella flava TaxID=349316 RepID=A0ABN2MV90_9ACTN
MVVDFDPDDPPLEPPDGTEPVVWRMAQAIRAAHQPDSTACCVTCRVNVPWPCPPSRLAARGFLLAIRLRRTSRR